MKTETFARKRRVKLQGNDQQEVERLRYGARWAYLDGRTARARDLNAVAAHLERSLREAAPAPGSQQWAETYSDNLGESPDY